MLGVLPWLLLALGFLLFRENRCAQALWILLPILILRLMWQGFTAIVGMPSEANALFIPVINCLLIGFSLNWLLAERIGNRNRFITFLLSIVIFAVMTGVSVIEAGIRVELLAILIFTAVTVGILLLSMVLAGFCCRKRFAAWKYILWMAVWLLILSILSFSIVLVIQGPAYMSIDLILMFTVQILIVSAVYFVGLLPFEILLFVNGFWRKRFEAVMGMGGRRQKAFQNPLE